MTSAGETGQVIASSGSFQASIQAHGNHQPYKRLRCLARGCKTHGRTRAGRTFALRLGPSASPGAVGRGAKAQVYRNIIDAATQYTDKLCLGLGRHLKVETPNRSSLERERLVVLYEARRETKLSRGFLVVGLDKIAPRIVKIPRLQNFHSRKSGDLDVHR
jgi:hypothetical protein